MLPFYIYLFDSFTTSVEFESYICPLTSGIDRCLEGGLNQCDHNCTSTEVSYYCSCLPGYRLVNNTNCIDIDECTEGSDTCHANATCMNTVGSFSCDCNGLYTGDGENCTGL